MKLLKSRLLCVAAVLLAVLLSGCDRMSFEIADLVIPPSPSGRLAKISEALYEAVDGDITLRYPKSGEYRSAFVIRDIDGDAVEEALAFYSTSSTEKTTVMHVNFIAYRSGSYTSVDDFSFECSGVNSVNFSDLSGDGIPEIIITWTLPSSLTNKISVFGYSERKGVSHYIFEDYSVYTVCDLDGKGDNELLIVSNRQNSTNADAKAYKIEASAALRIGYCRMDGTVKEYSAPVLSRLTDGTPAVFIDAGKGTEGTVTELLFFNSNYMLVNPFVNDETGINEMTYRFSSAYCSDFNGDGILEIPCVIRLPDLQGDESGTAAYLTEWKQFTANDEAGKLTTVSHALMNYTDGYCLTVSAEWSGRLSVKKELDTRTCTVYSYDAEKGEATERLFAVRLLETEVWKSTALSEHGYFAAAENAALTVAVRIFAEESGLDESFFRENIRFIS